MNKLKSLCLSASLLLAAVLPSKAQNYANVNLIGTASSSYGCSVAGSTATNFNVFLDISLQRSGSFALIFSPDAAGTATNTAWLAPSVDGVNVDTNKAFYISAPAKGAGIPVTISTNYNDSWLGAYPYVCLMYITNSAGSGNSTNVQFEWSINRSKR